ncbi:MAG: EAL domain-containing protein [Pseudomonadales bacterium]|nr:EAL domain-containing protein [Pseudomonadales bacterium]
MENQKKLKVLIVDDSENDALLLVRELKKGGYDPSFHRVESESELESALCEPGWELVITDHNMPGFSSREALELVKKANLDVPVIIVSGAIGEDVAVSAMKAGAHDYIMKDSLKRLVPAINRELRDAETRREKVQAELALSHMIYHDPLTNLANRPQLHHHLQEALQQSLETKTLVAVLFVDLDRFKVINDTFGHSAGDNLLQEVAARLRRCVRYDDIIARYGGDEFILILENILCEEEAGVVAELIIKMISEPFEINGHEMFIGSSIGIALSDVSTDVETLIKSADLAMYQAKSVGRNNYQFYSPDMDDLAERRRQLEQSLHKAMSRDELELYFQPQLCLHTGQLRGAEVLLRWHHPEYGLIPPDSFIDLLEETGLVIPVGDWVLRTACTLWKSWQDRGLVPKEAIVSVNISAYQFRGGGLVASVESVLREVGFTPGSLDLEITEGTLMENTRISQDVLHQLKRMGVKMSIDDFGTGYSSLSYLKRFPIDSLKIDKSFVLDIVDNPDDAVIATAIIGLAHNLGLEVTAEGVENTQALEFLKENGCDFYQGFYYSKPLPVEDFLERIA